MSPSESDPTEENDNLVNLKLMVQRGHKFATGTGILQRIVSQNVIGPLVLE